MGRAEQGAAPKATALMRRPVAPLRWRGRLPVGRGLGGDGAEAAMVGTVHGPTL